MPEKRLQKTRDAYKPTPKRCLPSNNRLMSADEFNAVILQAIRDGDQFGRRTVPPKDAA